MLLDSTSVGICVSNAWSRAHAQKVPYVRKNLQRIWVTAQRFLFVFRGMSSTWWYGWKPWHSAYVWKPLEQEWSHLLFILFGYSHRNCDWLLCRLMEKIEWIILVAWMCLLLQDVLSLEKFIATGWVWGAQMSCHLYNFCFNLWARCWISLFLMPSKRKTA